MRRLPNRPAVRVQPMLEVLENRLTPSWTSTPPATVTPPTSPVAVTLDDAGDALGQAAITANEVDYFSFVAPTGGSYRFEAQTPSSDLDPVLAVYNAAGQRVAYDDDSGPAFDSLANASLNAGSQYYLGVTNYRNTAGGSYTWLINGPSGSTPPPTPGNALLPDLQALADEGRGYLYGWTIDTSTLPGRTLMRLTSASANVGAGPMEIRGSTVNANGTQTVLQRIYNDQGGFTERTAGEFIHHAQHGHIHFEDYATYSLRTITAGGGVGAIASPIGHKVSFCLLDSTRYVGSLPNSPSSAQYETCGQIQGISVGWADVYNQTLPDQWIDITGMAAGDYWLEFVVDPDNRLVESDETNNVVRIRVTIPGSGGGGTPGDDHVNAGDWGSATPVPLDGSGAGYARGTLGTTGDTDLFRFTAAQSGRVSIRLDTPNSNLDPYLYVYDGSSGHGLLASNDDTNGIDSQVSIDVVAGQTYYILADNYADGSVGEFVLGITTEAASPGDDFANAGAWANAGLLTVDSANRGSIQGTIENNNDADLFRFTAARSGQVVIRLDTPASSLDPYLYVYDESDGHALLASNDDANGVDSRVTLNVVAGRTYFLLADNYANRSRGSYVLSIQ